MQYRGDYIYLQGRIDLSYYLTIIIRLGGSTGPKVCSVVVCMVTLNVKSNEVYAKGNVDERLKLPAKQL